MKSQLLVVILICFSCLLVKPVAAQQLLNGGFEDIYFNENSPELPRPEFWGFAWEYQYCNMPLGELTNDSHFGNWAAKLETTDCFGMVNAAWVNNIIDTTQFFLPVMGHPLNARPDQASFYYKYLPVNGDTAYYSIFTFSLPDTLDYMDAYWYFADTISFSKGYFIEEESEYTQLIHNFEYESLETPQYIQFRFLSNKHSVHGVSLNYDQGHVGTTLWIDDVELIYLNTSSQNLLQEVDVQIYPNPITDYFQVEVPPIIVVQSIQVHDFTGKLVKTLNPQNRFHSMNELPAGMYFVTLHTEQGSVVKKLVKE